MALPRTFKFDSVPAILQERSGRLINRGHDVSRSPQPCRDMITHDGEFNPRVPQRLLTLLIDTSASMRENTSSDSALRDTPIRQVNRSAADFAADCCRDVLTRDSLQVQLVTFGGSVQVYPFVPVRRFTPPTLSASGDTPLAEALLAAVAETERYAEFLKAAEVEALKPYYFLFSDGKPNRSSLLVEAAACIRRQERDRQGAFYGFGVHQAAVEALQPLFAREVFLLSEHNFADFFHIISQSVCRVSSTCISEDLDLTPLIKDQLRIGHEGNDA